MRPLGSIVVDEQIVPIVELRLDKGALWLIAHVRGPVPAVDTLNYIVVGRDGRQVWHGTAIGQPIRWPVVYALDELSVSLRLEVQGLAALL